MRAALLPSSVLVLGVAAVDEQPTGRDLAATGAGTGFAAVQVLAIAARFRRGHRTGSHAQPH